MTLADALAWPRAATLRSLAPALLLMAAALLIFRDTAVAMVTIWERSGTFAHAFLVPPIVLWMVWRRREALAAMQARPALGMLLPLAGAALLWLLADLAGVNAAAQFALVAMLVLSVPLVYGVPVARALLFPLVFSFFAVPVGEFMVPSMMEWTANFTVAALQATGVPVLREGLQFVIPSGNWSVVEACSGVRYLIASFMVGTLFAYLNFRSTRRRVLFMAVSLLVPIVANWLRAYLIVMLGHLSGNEMAAGADHLVYGWGFFGLVIGVMFLAGSRWTEPEESLPVAAPRPEPGLAAADSAAPAWRAAAVGVLVLVATQAVSWQINRPHEGPPPALALPGATAPGWAVAAQPASAWKPNFAHASVDASRSYSRGAETVGVWVAYYRDQNYERKLVTSGNSLAELSANAAWAQVASGGTQIALPQGPLALRTATLRGSSSPGVAAAERLRVWQVYWVGGTLHTSDARAKLQLAFNRLLGRGDDSAALFYYTAEGGSPQAADATLARFVGAHHGAIVERLSAARGAR